MTSAELIASRLKSLAHNPDHPDSILPQVPWSDIDYGTMLPMLTEDSFIIMDYDTYISFRRHRRDFFCVPTPLWYSEVL